jgi:hypothetical protein
MEFAARQTNKAHSELGKALFLKSEVIALYYSMIDIAMRLRATQDGLPWATGI